MMEQVDPTEHAGPPLRLLLVRTTAAAADALEGMLEDRGALGSAVERRRGTRLVRLQAYFPPEINVPVEWVRERLAELHANGIPVGPAEVRVLPLPQEDWAESWKRHYRPIQITTRLWIVPSWDPVDAPPDASLIRIDPGMAFGWGDHPTTRGCLEMLERLGAPQHGSAPRPERLGAPRPDSLAPEAQPSKAPPRGAPPPDSPPPVVQPPGAPPPGSPPPAPDPAPRSPDPASRAGFPTADVGSGTGVLAIRAVQLGLGPVEAFDVDPDAVRTTGENAARNAMADRILVREGTLPPEGAGPYRLILANLFLTVLEQLAPRLARALAPGGELIAAGITGDQEDRFRECLARRGMRIVDRLCERAQPGGRRWPILRARREGSSPAPRVRR